MKIQILLTIDYDNTTPVVIKSVMEQVLDVIQVDLMRGALDTLTASAKEVTVEAIDVLKISSAYQKFRSSKKMTSPELKLLYGHMQAVVIQLSVLGDVFLLERNEAIRVADRCGEYLAAREEKR